MKRLLPILPLPIYVVTSLFFFGSTMGRGSIFQGGVDPIAYIWFLNWWPFAVSHHINPSISHYIWNPSGFPMWWANSIPSIALILAPVTMVFGAVKSWNLISLLAPSLNAYACYMLLRYLTKHRFSAFLGAALFGFSSYIASEQLAHISLSFVPFVPLVVLLVLRRVNQEIGRANYISLMSMLGVLQFGISTEVLASSALFGLIAFAAFAWRYRGYFSFYAVARETVFAALIAVVVISPALYYMWLGADQTPPVINSPVTFSADLFNFFVPNTTTLIGGRAFERVSSQFTGTVFAQGAYLGIPLLLIVVLSIVKNRSRRWSLPLLLVLLSTIILSLGPVLWLNGHKTKIPLPWEVLLHVPLLRHALPTRFSLYTSLTVSIFVALWVSQREEGAKRSVIRYSMVLLALATILPDPRTYQFVSPSTPSVFARLSANGQLGKDTNLVVLPYGNLGNSLLWQFESGMSYRMAGGYVGFTPADFLNFRATFYFFGIEHPVNQQEFNDSITEFCGSNNVSDIVITPGTADWLTASLVALPWKKEVIGDSTVIRVPSNDKLRYLSINGEYFSSGNGSSSWMGSHVSVTNHSDAPRKIAITRFAAPSSVGDFHIYTSMSGVIASYRITDNEIEVSIPARATMTITSDKTWVPEQYMHNGDLRNLSVGLRLLN